MTASGTLQSTIDAAGRDLPSTFAPFSPMHALCVVACAAVMLAAALAGRRLRTRPAAEERLRRSIAISGVIYWAASNAWWMWPANFKLEDSLPLHVCDLAGIIAPVAILTRKPWLRALLYFWGIGLSTQAFFTPTLEHGPASMRFWLFWLNHTFIVGTAVYDIAVGGYRPTWRDFRTAAAVSLAYLAFILLIDIPLGLNYGYVGNTTPENPTVIDKLGPWPLRLLPLTLIGMAMMFLVWIPWIAAAKHAGRRSARGMASADQLQSPRSDARG
ncbi:MAG: TIGR02206 family membrane protein [Phycisphaerales bacterium]|nr:TIGR02206 family membrane protein [Phycisphaerales bacterium]